MEKHLPKESAGNEFFDAETKVHLVSIIDNAPGFVYSIDTNFRLITINQPLRKVLHETFGLKLSPGDSAIKFFEDVSPSLADEWKRIYMRAIAGEKLQFV
jgi:hypothetical protein